MKPRARLFVVLTRLAVLAAALSFWAAVARACKDLME